MFTLGPSCRLPQILLVISVVICSWKGEEQPFYCSPWRVLIMPLGASELLWSSGNDMLVSRRRGAERHTPPSVLLILSAYILRSGVWEVHDLGCAKTLPKRSKVPAFCPKWCPFSSIFLSLPAESIARGSRGRSWFALIWGSISLGPETSFCAGQRPLMLGKWTHCHLDFLHDSYFYCLRPHLQISSIWLWMHRVRHLSL